MKKTFRFKQFEIIQEKTGMRLSTDSVLLGAWVKADNPSTILDIGTGTGILTLMCAQKFENSQIKALEIEPVAFQEATENFKNSDWNNRISAVNIDFIEFAEKTKQTFDLIICNPPYYENHLTSNDENRNLARHSDSLPFDKLIKNANNILNENGKFSVVIPFFLYEKFNFLCNKSLFFCSRKSLIYPTENKNPNRILLEYTKNPQNIEQKKIIIKHGNFYTKQFLELTKDFYLFA